MERPAVRAGECTSRPPAVAERSVRDSRWAGEDGKLASVEALTQAAIISSKVRSFSGPSNWPSMFRKRASKRTRAARLKPLPAAGAAVAHVTS